MPGNGDFMSLQTALTEKLSTKIAYGICHEGETLSRRPWRDRLTRSKRNSRPRAEGRHMARRADRITAEIKLIDDDGEPLESPWHLVSILILLDCLTYYLQPRTDYFVGGNMFLYYSL